MNETKSVLFTHNNLILMCPKELCRSLRVQLNLDYLNLDYPDFLIIRTFSLVLIWS